MDDAARRAARAITSVSPRCPGPVTIAGTQGTVNPRPNPGRRLSVPSLSDPSRSSLTPSAAQLRINQRIAQAAVRRANGLRERLDGRLTGGGISRGAITPAELAPGLEIVSADNRLRPPTSQTEIAPPRRGQVEARAHRGASLH